MNFVTKIVVVLTFICLCELSDARRGKLFLHEFTSIVLLCYWLNVRKKNSPIYYEGISLICTPDSEKEGFPFSRLEPQQKVAHLLICRFINCIDVGITIQLL